MTKLLCLGFLFLHATWGLGANLRKEVSDPSAVKAHQEFWTSFDEYEANAFAKSQGNFLESWQRLQKEWKHNELELGDAQIRSLQLAVQRYQDHLRTHADASNSPYVRLNLAQVLSKLGHHLGRNGEPYKKQALAVLADLARDYPSFAMLEESLYLKASILESLDQSESAYKIWKTLADKAKSSIYGMHAHLAIGDHAFAKEHAAEALKAYQKASQLVSSLKLPDYERIRVHYRLAWAAYRAAELELSIVSATQLLEPEADFRQISLQKQMTKDACDLIGDALFEKDDQHFTKTYLQRETIRPYAGAVGLKIMARMASNPSTEKMTDIGEFLLARYAQAKEIPEIASLMADNYKKDGQQDRYLATLERLSLLLPKGSLWRVQHKDDLAAIAAMEGKALSATQLLAGQFYEDGLVQSRASSFASARTYYEALLRYDPQHSQAETWDLRRGHCFYFANQWDEADQAYEQFKTRSQPKVENLEVAYYHQILAREKNWRQSLGNASRAGGTQLAAAERLRKLERGIDDFADRFPNRPHGTDLLLLVASANRDIGNLQQAERYWNRSLLSEPSANQRTLAIRGLVQSKFKGGSPEETLALARNYIKLENFRELGKEFQGELYSSLASAVSARTKELSSKGKILEAGQLQLAMADEFPDLPKRNEFYRDGAYNLALAGEWKGAGEAANSYLASHNKSAIVPDMMYLKARSEEYQLRFGEAAKSHLALAEHHGKYSRVLASLQRSEELASGEDDFKTAGRASLLASYQKKDPQQKHDSILRAAEYYAKAYEWKDSLDALSQAEKVAKSPGLKMKTQLMTAKIWEAQGEREKALDSYRKLASEADRLREDLDKSLYTQVAGEANFLLGEAEKERTRQEDPLGEVKNGSIERSLNFYNKAIATQDPEWSTRARYGAASLAESVSDSIRSAAAKRDKVQTETLKERAKRWQGLALQYHSQNVMARQKDPSLDNIWIERSALRMSGDQPNLPGRNNALPPALDSKQPYQWSH